LLVIRHHAMLTTGVKHSLHISLPVMALWLSKQWLLDKKLSGSK